MNRTVIGLFGRDFPVWVVIAVASIVVVDGFVTGQSVIPVAGAACFITGAWVDRDWRKP